MKEVQRTYGARPVIDYGIRWVETMGREMRTVTKEKVFPTEKARDKFIEKLEAKENFVELLAWHN